MTVSYDFSYQYFMMTKRTEIKTYRQLQQAIAEAQACSANIERIASEGRDNVNRLISEGSNIIHWGKIIFSAIANLKKSK